MSPTFRGKAPHSSGLRPQTFRVVDPIKKEMTVPEGHRPYAHRAAEPQKQFSNIDLDTIGWQLVGHFQSRYGVTKQTGKTGVLIRRLLSFSLCFRASVAISSVLKFVGPF